MRSFTKRSPIVVAWIAALGLGCGETGGPGAGPAMVSGRIGAGAFAQTERPVVRAFGVQGGGSLTGVSDGVSVDAEGRYRLVVTIPEDGAQDLLIRAQAGSTEGSVILSGTITPGDARVAAPITLETSVEGDLLVQGEATASWPGEVSSGASLRALVSADLAADLRASGNYSAALSSSAEATVSGMEAFEAMLVNEAAGAADAQVEAALDAVLAAQTDADVSLDAASTAAEQEAAAQAYLVAAAQAWADAGISARQLAIAAHARAEAMWVYATGLPGDVRAQVESAIEGARANLVTAAIEAEFGTIAAGSATLEAVVQAGGTLRADIQSAADAGAQAQAAIEIAWSDYAAAVKAQLDAAVQAAVQGDVSGAMDLLAQSVANLRAELQAAVAKLSATLDADATVSGTVNALGRYFVSATAEANVNALVEAGLSRGMAEAAVRALAIVDASLIARGPQD
jgi:hypothetical protein